MKLRCVHNKFPDGSVISGLTIGNIYDGDWEGDRWKIYNHKGRHFFKYRFVKAITLNNNIKVL